MALNQEQIKVIEDRRAEGCSWTEVAKYFNDIYGTSYTRDAMRLKYNYYAGEEPQYDNAEQLKKQRRSQLTAAEARKKLKKTLDAQIILEDVLQSLKEAVKDIKKQPKVRIKKLDRKKTKITLEALIGDIQIGKIMDDYNTEICGRRMKEHGEAIILRIQQYQKQGFEVERIILTCLGDMIESSHKHKNSMRATDVSNPEQMRAFVVFFYQHILMPIAQLGIKTDVNCVTGNHDWNGSGLEMFYPGMEHLSWMFYHMLAELCKVAGYTHLSFTIPKGAFMVYEIYGHNVLVEHGVGVSTTEASMGQKLNIRMRQTKQNITFFRMGDKHTVTMLNNGQYIVNGAYFGKDEKGVEYSGILGYHTPPAQVLTSYVQRKKDDPRNPFFESFIIQLEHIK